MHPNILPTYNDLIDYVIKLIKSDPQTRKSASASLAKLLKISNEQQQIKSSSGTFTFENRVGWAFTYLTKAEYIKKTSKKAQYEITELGILALQNASEKKLIIDTKYLEENSLNYWDNWKVNTLDKNQISNAKEDIVDDEDPFMNLEESIDEFNAQFEIELLNKIKNLSWQDFEDLCSQLIEKMGYGVASTRTLRQHDGGIDGEILEDELGIKGVIYIQAKKYDTNNVGVGDIKSFLHTINKNKGIFITTADFTKEAKLEAKPYRGRVALINKDDLIKYCKKFEIKCIKQSTVDIFKVL
ncbi:MAG: hypothetical protein FJX30_06420 [Alphaproteobacteria bacterium]|nr:hypothetical protein [Alphaproteobacteria bacterium]